MNNVVIVGRIAKDLKLEKTENGKSYINTSLAVNRPYKNIDGIHETDFINCTLWGSISERAYEYCQKGDVVGVKGHLETSSYEKDGNTKYTYTVNAEKITFLSNKKETDKNNEQEL